MTEADGVEGPIEKVTPEETAKEIRSIKPGKAVGPSEVYTEVISARGNWIDVMMKFFN